MGILLEIGLVLVIIGVVFTMATRGKNANERETLTERRVEAYMQTIRRERSNPELSAMSDVELRDLLLSSARNLKIETERKTWVLVGIGAVSVVAGFVVANQDGPRGFAIALAIGAVAIYGLNEFWSRRMRDPLVARGIDIERLKVE
ncbi:hypothetical protein [Paradevosia shaoguanensis]|uniref:Uncharacterized protein n=1 Tax=Paradevosia shaoguanensis TaxID=1335043 RepID=A0AA41UH54_9HYPH|nr:hypothetical protein [Paradevosia shaoguanensis]MCF1743538.1 hypothetical protein [Paradevosia shaoguanensis]MCI0128021.1 hypothetical protein [Paradevosia shaoguanensis]